MVFTMAPYSFVRALYTLPFLFPVAFSHMQMSDPSPLRDPHSDRASEPKDYNILNPLHADGSDFSCKGYQWNTPLTVVATYNAGETYGMKLKGSATHGGGSCQISMSCDNGINFKVLRSIMGGCPLSDTYDFTIPAQAQSGQCLLAWTWFNKIGNREMYMNCAVVDIVGSSSNDKRDTSDTSAANAAQAALKKLPDLYVANLASINSCRVTETQDAIFDNPGADVAYGDGLTASSAATGTGKKSACTGQGRETVGGASALASESPSSPPAEPSVPKEGTYGNDGGSYGDDGKWHGDSDTSKPNVNGDSARPVACNDGQWHPECYGQAATAPQGTTEQPVDHTSTLNDDTSSNDMVNMDGMNTDTTRIDDSEEQVSKQTPEVNPLKSTKKPKKHHHSFNDDNDYNYDYYDRQVTTRDPQDPTPSSDPVGGTTLSGLQIGSSPPLDSDPDLIDNFVVSSDETTSYMAVVDGTSTTNVPVPTDGPVFDSDGDLLVDTVPDAVQDGNADFLVPVPVVNTPTSVPGEDVNGDFPGDMEDFPTVVNDIDPETTANLSDLPAFTPVIEDSQFSENMEAFPWIVDDLAPTPTSGVGDDVPTESAEVPKPRPQFPADMEDFPTIVDDTTLKLASPAEDILTEPTGLEFVDDGVYWSELGYFNTSTANGAGDLLPTPTSDIIIEDSSMPTAEGLVDESLYTPVPVFFSAIPAPTTMVSLLVPASSNSDVVLPEETGVATNDDPSNLEDIPNALLKIPFFKAVQDITKVLKKGGAFKNGGSKEVPQGNTSKRVPLNRQAVVEEPDFCSDITPVTVYARPPASWYAENTPPPSFSGTPGVDAPADCLNAQWNCGGCNSPDRCILINSCTRSCIRLPYTDLPTSTPTPASAIETLPPAPASPVVTENINYDATPEQCPPQFIADLDPNESHLPCQPGSFLCKSSTQFYTCGQFGGGVDGWSYGALRDVAAGMNCAPGLTKDSMKSQKLRRDANAMAKFKGKSLRGRQWECLEKMKKRHGSRSLVKGVKVERDADVALEDAVYGYCFDWYNGYRKGIAADQISPFKKWINGFRESYGKALGVIKRHIASIYTTGVDAPINATAVDDTDLTSGGDGTDEDPAALFGAEPAEHEEEWSVEDDTDDGNTSVPSFCLDDMAAVLVLDDIKARTLMRAIKKRQDEGEDAPVDAQEDVPEVAPDDAPEATQEDTQETAPEDAPENAPEDTQEDTPEDTPEIAPEESQKDADEDANYGDDSYSYPEDAEQDADEDGSTEPTGNALLNDVLAIFPDIQEPDLVYDSLQDPNDPNTVLDDAYTYVDDDNEIPPFDEYGNPLPGFDKYGDPIPQPPGPQVDAQGNPVTNPLVAPTPIPAPPFPLNVTTSTNASTPVVTSPFLPEDPNAPMNILPVLSSATPIPVSVLPWLMGPGPVVPPGMSMNWPGPKGPGRGRPTVGAAPAFTGRPAPRPATSAVVERKSEGMGRKGRRGSRAKRQACPPLIKGYYRNDQYV